PRIVARSMDYNVALIEPIGRQTRIGDCIGRIGTIDEVLARRTKVRLELGLDDAPPPLAQVFPDCKQALLRDGWGPLATYVTFDATRRLGYHWHPGRNSVQLQFRGQNLINDPGRMGYAANAHRAWAVSTQAHPTMNLNGWDQASSEPSFRHRAAPGYDIVDSLYDGGYWEMSPIGGHRKGMYAEHHRTLIWVHGRFLVVLDNLYHTQEEGQKPAVECNWLFGPGEARMVSDGHVVSTHGDATMHLFTALKPKGMAAKLHHGSESPCVGWVADESDKPAAAPWLHQRVENFDPWNADVATVLLPLTSPGAPEPVVEESVDPAKNQLGKFVLRWPDGSSDTFCWTRRLEKALFQAGVPSDSSLVHVHADKAGRVMGGLVWEGSFLEPHTGPAIDPRATFTLKPAR
ncbi:MAG: heparinase II/III family protein, partial [Planctomycetota bacterium]|nr:heparinase II/III family protein [Planctomycetota bacterium]